MGKLKVYSNYLRKPFIRKWKTEKIELYWKNPPPLENHPKKYLNSNNASLLYAFFQKWIPKDASILELGSNIGNNLHYLFKNGYKKNFGIEFNKDAIQYSLELFKDEMIIFEQNINNIKLDQQFDCIFSSQVLMHITNPPFEKIAEMTKKYIICFESEKLKSYYHFPRNYQKIYENLGFKQIDGIEGIKSNSNLWHMKLRVFERI